ncbi:MAG: M23 family metallopeptidase [Desulfamplus sp.]|nr:M23 family metallopeptidase [Desulfamplus sp.]
MFLNYLSDLAELNSLPLYSRGGWIFHPGMLFGSPFKWWGSGGLRATLHEGVDVVMYKNKDGETAHVTPTLEVPSIFHGVVLNICSDFLGKSVIVSHRDNFCLVYAHIEPAQSLRSGTRLARGEVLGNVADTSGKKSGIPSHLHVTALEILMPIAHEKLDWNLFIRRDQDYVLLYDPVHNFFDEHNFKRFHL